MEEKLPTDHDELKMVAMLIKTMNLEARVRGIDADSRILEIARSHLINGYLPKSK